MATKLAPLGPTGVPGLGVHFEVVLASVSEALLCGSDAGHLYEPVLPSWSLAAMPSVHIG